MWTARPACGGYVGVKVPAGVGEINAVYQVRNVDDAANLTRACSRCSMHPLSKRTSVYTSVGHHNKGNAASAAALAHAAGGGPAAGADVRGFQVACATSSKPEPP